MRIDLGLDTRLETSTQEDLDYIQANFREGERMEQEAVEAGHDTLDLFEQCFTVWYKDERIGYCGIMLQPGQTILSPSRFVAYMSCENANRHKFYYVKQSRKVLKAVVDQVQPWVSEFHSLPDERYTGSVKWHERILKMRRIGTFRYKNSNMIHFVINRKEV